jgi:hypothetical protein
MSEDSETSSLAISDYEAYSSESDREKVEFIANAKKLLEKRLSGKVEPLPATAVK